MGTRKAGFEAIRRIQPNEFRKQVEPRPPAHMDPARFVGVAGIAKDRVQARLSCTLRPFLDKDGIWLSDEIEAERHNEVESALVETALESEPVDKVVYASAGSEEERNDLLRRGWNLEKNVFSKRIGG